MEFGTSASRCKEGKKKMISAPRNYSEWVEVLGKLKTKFDDSEVLTAMKKGRLEWQSGIAERFIKRLTDAVNERMNIASEKFQKEMSRSNGKESSIVQSIILLRKEMLFLAQVVDLPTVPEAQRSQLVSMIIEQANAMQKSLEDSAKKDRSGKLSSIIRNNKVNLF